MTAAGKRKQEIVLNFPHSLTRGSITQFLMYTFNPFIMSFKFKGSSDDGRVSFMLISWRTD